MHKQANSKDSCPLLPALANSICKNQQNGMSDHTQDNFVVSSDRQMASWLLSCGSPIILRIISWNWNMIVGIPCWLSWWEKSFAVIGSHLLNWDWKQEAEAQWTTCSLVLVVRDKSKCWIAQHQDTNITSTMPTPWVIASYELSQAPGKASSSAALAPASALAPWLCLQRDLHLSVWLSMIF